MKRLPEWLRARLGDQGGQRAAKSGTCPKCKRDVLRGMDADRCAGMAEVDAHEVDEMGEVLALLRGLTTYDLTLRGGAWELEYRGVTHIKLARAYPVFASHDCTYLHPVASKVHRTLLRNEFQAYESDTPPF